MRQLEGFEAAVGRILMSVIFLFSGIWKIAGWPGVVAALASKGLPLPAFGVGISIVLEVVGGALLILGYRVRIVSFLLFLFLIPATLMFHNFWAYHGAERQDLMIHFLKNLAIMGGLLLVAVHGAGGCSLDAARSHSN